jgi:hypothetical protein
MVFMEPGGPAIMCRDDRLNVIFLSVKMGNGEGSGSPADNPRLTALARVFN